MTGAVTAYIEVDASGAAPLLAVHEVLYAWRGGTPDAAVTNADQAPASAWPTGPEAAGTLDVRVLAAGGRGHEDAVPDRC